MIDDPKNKGQLGGEASSEDTDMNTETEDTTSNILGDESAEEIESASEENTGTASEDED